MSVKLAVTGSVVAGLLAVGGVAAVATWQPVQAPAPATVRMVQPAADTSTPTETATVAPVVVPTAVAPAPVESAPAPAPVVAPKPEVVMPKAVAPAAPAPVPADVQNNPNLPHDANGNVVLPPVVHGNGQQIDGHGVPIPTPTP